MTTNNYKLISSYGNNTGVLHLQTNLNIPLIKENRHYQNFKKEIENDEAELQDADGNVMTAEEAKAYIATLPA